MRNVTCNTNLKIFKGSELFVNGHQVKQTLTWVLPWTITTIDNRGLNSSTINQLLVVIDFRVANHTDINTQSRHRQNRIIEGFTLIYWASPSIKLNHVQSKFFLSHFEGLVCSCWIFKKEIGSEILSIQLEISSAVFKISTSTNHAQDLFIREGFHSHQMF